MKSKRKPSPLPPLYSHEELIKKLSASFPEEAFKDLGNGLTEIRFQFQAERMNEVFGVGGWRVIPRFQSEMLRTNGGDLLYRAKAKVTVEVPRYGISQTQVGSSDNSVLDYAIKGAVTSATGKCLSLLGIASEIYKGQRNGQSNGKSAQYSPDAQKNLWLVGVESGYKLCEKGHNIQKAMEIAGNEWEQHK